MRTSKQIADSVEDLSERRGELTHNLIFGHRDALEALLEDFRRETLEAAAEQCESLQHGSLEEYCEGCEACKRAILNLRQRHA